MQLNNKITGQIIRIDKIKDSGIYYSVFENSKCLSNNNNATQKIVDKIDESYIPTSQMSISDAIKEAANIKILETEIEFELDDDIQNWLVQERNKRIFVKNDFLTSKMLDDVNFKLVIDKLIEKNNNPELPKIIFKNQYSTLVYVNGVDEEDLPIVYPYIISGDLIIEEKL